MRQRNGCVDTWTNIACVAGYSDGSRFLRGVGVRWIQDRTSDGLLSLGTVAEAV